MYTVSPIIFFRTAFPGGHFTANPDADLARVTASEVVQEMVDILGTTPKNDVRITLDLRYFHFSPIDFMTAVQNQITTVKQQMFAAHMLMQASAPIFDAAVAKLDEARFHLENVMDAVKQWEDSILPDDPEDRARQALTVGQARRTMRQAVERAKAAVAAAEPDQIRADEARAKAEALPEFTSLVGLPFVFSCHQPPSAFGFYLQVNEAQMAQLNQNSDSDAPVALWSNQDIHNLLHPDTPFLRGSLYARHFADLAVASPKSAPSDGALFSDPDRHLADLECLLAEAAAESDGALFFDPNRHLADSGCLLAEAAAEPVVATPQQPPRTFSPLPADYLPGSGFGDLPAAASGTSLQTIASDPHPRDHSASSASGSDLNGRESDIAPLALSFRSSVDAGTITTVTPRTAEKQPEINSASCCAIS